MRAIRRQFWQDAVEAMLRCAEARTGSIIRKTDIPVIEAEMTQALQRVGYLHAYDMSGWSIGVWNREDWVIQKTITFVALDPAGRPWDIDALAHGVVSCVA